jgi:N-acetylmuramoyl-L-alanine amidase
MPLMYSRQYAAVLLAALAGAAAAAFYARAQPQSPPSKPAPMQVPAISTLNRNLVFLDPAHGGPDAGATLGDKIYEKDVTLAIVARLRATLTAAGFTVLSTREADSATPLTNDQRAEIANRSHAVACIVLHATTSGAGVHLYTSALPPPQDDADASASPPSPHPFIPISWETAQAGSVRQSLHLADDLSAALAAINLPLVVGREPVPPLDNMTCPAVAIELAPLPVAGSDATPVTDANYQQRVVDRFAAALLVWRDQAEPVATRSASSANSTAAAQSTAQPQSAAQAHAAAKAMAVAEAGGLASTRAHARTSTPPTQAGIE